MVAQSASLDRRAAGEQQAYSVSGSEDMNVQLDVDRNLVVVAGARTEDGQPGSVTVIDYDKNLVSIYDAKTRICYMTNGNPKSTLRVPAESQNGLNAPASSESSTYRLVGDDGFAGDRALLPAPLKDICEGLPLKVMGTSAKSTDTSGAQGGETLGRPQRFWSSLWHGAIHAASHFMGNY
jgi:hypothetical protein